MIFTDRSVKLDLQKPNSTFFSTTITNEKGYFTNIHCLITYELISPEIVEETKPRNMKPGSFKFVPNCSEIQRHTNDGSYYVPVALCLLTNSVYIDVFRVILDSLYCHLTQVAMNDGLLVSSLEFVRNISFLLNDTIVPPNDVEYCIDIGKIEIALPVNYKDGLPHNESNIAVLLGIVDIHNIINF